MIKNKLIFLADVYLDKEYTSNIKPNSYIFNLEFPISSKGTPCKNKINLIQKKSYIKETFGSYPVAVCLANNHIMDYGEEAFLDTIRFLDTNNIKYFGAGKKENNFNNPLILEIESKKISISAYSCESTSAVFGDKIKNGSAKIDLDKIVEDLNSSDVDFKVIQLHWGMEDVSFPRYEDVKIARQIIDAGADLIIGHHAHIVQSTEVYKGKKIFYGIGNCIFPDFELNSYFNGESFTRTSSKKQRIFNKQSILVELKSDLSVKTDQLYFDNGILARKKFRVPSFIPKSKKDFHMKYIKNKKYMMIRKFFESPKFPKIKQIKNFISESI